MGFDVQIRRHASYVRVKIVGKPSLGHVISLLHVIGLEIERWPSGKLVLDAREVTSEFSCVEGRDLGMEIAASLPLAQVAIVVPPTPVTQIMERAARRDGATVMAFAVPRDAIEWLARPIMAESLTLGAGP